ncbi:carboxypeptidase-like regulatory domain-containing protein [Flavobacterium antarcticum]|uniref:carboxypeptidase-like regulatory domain-containing protein n=1 Tax=Flavobacterium antarcticum TaxID=271155 RepID=UPI0003B52E9A|nr:carboxypeptidase-like regulatory domain-containing protein [Flavobacterium antarcticum]
MKKIIIVFILLSNLGWSQNKKFTGKIVDAETLQPVEFVNIFFEDGINANSTGSISNEIGEFSFSTITSQVTFSHINYESLSLTLNEKFNEIALKPKSYILEEIVISKTLPRDYLKKVISTNSNKIEKNTLFKTYCREIVKINNDYSKFSDALVDYYVKKGNGKSNIILTEHRALERPKIDTTDNFKFDNINSAFTLKDYVKNAYNFDKLEKIVKDKNYEFVRKIKKEANGDEYEYVEIIPNIDSDKMLNKGYVIIDQKTKNILEFKIYTAESHLKNAKLVNIMIAKIRLNYSLDWSKFNLINNQYILTYNKTEAGIYVKMGDKVNDNFNFSSDLFVYEYKNDVQIPENGYKKRTIFEAGTKYKQEFWKLYNAFPLTASEQKFINSIIKN